MSRQTEASVRKALTAAQESEDGIVDARTQEILENALNSVWRKIQAAPSSYVMTTLEFAVFNRYRSRTQFQNETAQTAVQRYWSNATPNGRH